MFLSKVSLQNFRNYQKKTFQFEGLTTLVVGPNTSGKTNLLEAIYLLATGRSFRAEVEAEMIRSGEEMARVGAEIEWRKNNIEFQAARDTFLGRAYPFAPLKVADSPQKGHFAASLGDSSLREERTKLEIILTTGSVSGKKVARKKCLVNGISRRMIDFIGQLKAVYFGPEDLQLVTNSPSLRRKYLDMVLSQVDREYRRASLSYEKGLRQRNKVLEEIREKHQGYQGYQENKQSLNSFHEYQGDRGEELRRRLYFWDQLLVKNGDYITGKREEFVEFLNNPTTLLNRNVVREGEEGGEGREGERGERGERGRFGVEYVKSVISPLVLEENFEREIRAGMTLVGPHRDDIRFVTRDTRHETRRKRKINLSSVFRVPCSVLHRDLSIYGSRGEQRLAVLWLKMGELEYVASQTEVRPASAEATAGKPVLLLDDIFSELDEKHREMVLGVLGKQQTIITTTDEGLVDKGEREKMQVIRLR